MMVHSELLAQINDARVLVEFRPVYLAIEVVLAPDGLARFGSVVLVVRQIGVEADAFFGGDDGKLAFAFVKFELLRVDHAHTVALGPCKRVRLDPAQRYRDNPGHP